jgi:hypothetical protein
MSAGRAAARRIASTVCDSARTWSGPDPEDLVRQLSGRSALSSLVCENVRIALAHCEDRIAAGTRMRTEWMPKACIGNDVTEWEAWTRPEHSPDAERLFLLAADLQLFLRLRDRLGDLLAAEAALEAIRREGEG